MLQANRRASAGGIATYGNLHSAAYFAHSLYYFPSSAILVQSFKSLLDAGVKTLLLAEWSLSISQPAALPHLLAVLLQSIDPLPEGNVRTVLSPAAYVDAATQAGWEVVGSRTFTPAVELEDVSRIHKMGGTRSLIGEKSRNAALSSDLCFVLLSPDLFAREKCGIYAPESLFFP